MLVTSCCSAVGRAERPENMRRFWFAVPISTRTRPAFRREPRTARFPGTVRAAMRRPIAGGLWRRSNRRGRACRVGVQGAPDHGDGVGGEQRHGDDQPSRGGGQQATLAALDATGSGQDVVPALLADQMLQSPQVGDRVARTRLGDTRARSRTIHESFLAFRGSFPNHQNSLGALALLLFHGHWA